MLISFTVENWQSFQRPARLSMVASRERQHHDRVPKLSKYNVGVLPIAAVYGGNASGKTNFFRALHFAKYLVVEGTHPDRLIPVDTFLLDQESKSSPSCFIFELCVDNTIYEYSFAVTQQAVISEKLVLINSSSEKVLFERSNVSQIKLHESLQKDERLCFAFQGTRDNQLFVTNAVSQKVEKFKPIYHWFKDTLVLMAPDDRFGRFERFFDDNDPSAKLIDKLLLQLDTGISHLDGEEIALKHAPFPERLKARLQSEIKEGMSVMFESLTGERFVVARKQGELIVKKLVTYHVGQDGIERKFEISQESDGTRRLLDLLPALIDISSANKVYVIDELDRSLHALATRQLLELYLASCSPDSRSQLVFTTHDLLLMDQQLLRRDEMWACGRDQYGVSTVFAFSEFKDIRSDKDIRKSYLQGRLGGIPNITARGKVLSQGS